MLLGNAPGELRIPLHEIPVSLFGRQADDGENPPLMRDECILQKDAKEAVKFLVALVQQIVCGLLQLDHFCFLEGFDGHCRGCFP